MTTHRLRIDQVFRVERAIIVEIEAPDPQSALDHQMEEDAPPPDHPRWTSQWTLENEDIEPAR
jgi:hypothetical protein